MTKLVNTQVEATEFVSYKTKTCSRIQVRSHQITRLESMLCALKIFRAQIFCNARNGQSSAQSLKNALAKRAGTYKKVLLHVRRTCEGGFSKRANLTGRKIFRSQKTNFPVWSNYWFFFVEKPRRIKIHPHSFCMLIHLYKRSIAKLLLIPFSIYPYFIRLFFHVGYRTAQSRNLKVVDTR